MKMSLVLGIVGMLLPMVAHTVEDEATQKVYVESAQIAFADGEIFAHIGGEWVQITAVHRDQAGYYVNMKKNPDVNQWWCPDCNYCNLGWSKTCQREYGNGEKCGYPRPW